MDGKRTERAVSGQKADVVIEEEVIDAISQMIHRTPKKECWGFLKQFDLVLSPVDSAAVRQYMDRG